jgi:hypothetical protein
MPVLKANDLGPPWTALSGERLRTRIYTRLISTETKALLQAELVSPIQLVEQILGKFH